MQRIEENLYPVLRNSSSEDHKAEKDPNVYFNRNNIMKMIEEINEPFTQHTPLMKRLKLKQPDVITQVLQITEQGLIKSLKHINDKYDAAQRFVDRARDIEEIIDLKDWRLLPDLPFLLTFIIKSNRCISDAIIQSAFHYSLGFKPVAAKALTPQYYKVIQTLNLILPVSEWQHTPLDKFKSYFKAAAHHTLNANPEGSFIGMCKTQPKP
jgi:hypothetical protein